MMSWLLRCTCSASGIIMSARMTIWTERLLPKSGRVEKATRTVRSGLRRGMDCSVAIGCRREPTSGGKVQANAGSKPLSAGLPCAMQENQAIAMPK